MSVDSTLDAAFTTLLGKFTPGVTSTGSSGSSGSSGTSGTVAIEPVTVCITFSGGGLALPSGGGLPGVVEIPGPLTLVWVHMFAGDEAGSPVAVTASVDLRLTSEGNFGGSTPIYGATLPRLQADAVASIDLSAWRRNYTTGDAILYRLASFSGVATWLSLTMQMRPVTAAQAVGSITDLAGNDVVDLAGNPITTRG